MRGTISTTGSTVHVLVVPADEEIVVARETAGVVERAKVSVNATH